MDATNAIATAVRRIFSAQKQSRQERFGNWNKRLSDALVKPFITAVAAGFKRGRGAAHATHSAVSAAGARALESADTINESTGNMLDEGKERKDVFGTDRVATIALTEATACESIGFNVAAKSKGKRVKWRAHKGACDECKSLDGKVVEVGKDFVAKDGTRVKHPGLHPSCACKLEVV